MLKNNHLELHEKNYSLIGRISLQKYPILYQKDKIIKGVHKKHKIKDLFSPDEPKKDNNMEEIFSLFNKYKLRAKGNDNSNKKKKSKLEFQCKLMKNNPKLSYHNRHLYSENKKKKIVVESDIFPMLLNMNILGQD